MNLEDCTPTYDDAALFFFSPLHLNQSDLPVVRTNYSLMSDLTRLQMSMLPFEVAPEAYGSLFLDLEQADNALNTTLVKPVTPSHMFNFTNFDDRIGLSLLEYARISLDWRKVSPQFVYGQHYRLVLYGRDNTSSLVLPPSFDAIPEAVSGRCRGVGHICW